MTSNDNSTSFFYFNNEMFFSDLYDNPAHSFQIRKKLRLSSSPDDMMLEQYFMYTALSGQMLKRMRKIRLLPVKRNIRSFYISLTGYYLVALGVARTWIY